MITTRVERVGLDQLDAAWNPFQSHYWAQVKRTSGWRSFAFRVTLESVEHIESFVILVLVRKLFFRTRLAYIPFAPPIHNSSFDVSSKLIHVALHLKPLLPKGTLLVRFDLPWGEPNDPSIPMVNGKHVRACRNSVQPEGTARIDLSAGIEQVRSNYRERARRNIRKAKSHGIVVRVWNKSDEAFTMWYQVYVETAKRDGFSARSATYLRNILNQNNSDVIGRLYLAYLGKKVMGGAIIIESKNVALYLYGASLRVEGSSPSYVLQDFALQEACSRGCLTYDFYGISGPGNRGMHLAGLRLFKRAFGGYVCYRAPSVDYVYKHFFRFLYVKLENIRYSMNRKRQPSRMSQQFTVGNEE